MTKILSLATILLFAASPTLSLAKRGSDDKNRSEFYGLIQERPQNELQGQWIIGDQVIITDPGTEFDQNEGNLIVGSCAKVKIRDGYIHEIDSEPMHDCR
jgi:hypothetical protein